MIGEAEEDGDGEEWDGDGLIGLGGVVDLVNVESEVELGVVVDDERGGFAMAGW